MSYGVCCLMVWCMLSASFVCLVFVWFVFVSLVFCSTSKETNYDLHPKEREGMNHGVYLPIPLSLIKHPTSHHCHQQENQDLDNANS